MTLRRTIPFWNKKTSGFGPIIYTPPLDVYTGAKRAYGFRLLRSAYTGPLFRLVRQSDSALIDIYPQSNGLINEAEILALRSNPLTDRFIIDRMYDQTGNGFDMNAVILNSNRPFIVPLGSDSFEYINGKNCLKSNGGAFVDSSPFMYASAANSFIAVIQGPNTNPTSSTLVGEGRTISPNPAYLLSIKFNATNSTQESHFIRNDANAIVRTSNVDSMGTLYDNNPHIVYKRDNGSNLRTRVDNSSDINVNYTRSGVLTLNTFSFLCWGSTTNRNGFTDIKLGEIIFFDSNQDSNASGLISNLNDYYGTY